MIVVKKLHCVCTKCGNVPFVAEFFCHICRAPTKITWVDPSALQSAKPCLQDGSDNKEPTTILVPGENSSNEHTINELSGGSDMTYAFRFKRDEEFEASLKELVGRDDVSFCSFLDLRDIYDDVLDYLEAYESELRELEKEISDEFDLLSDPDKESESLKNARDIRIKFVDLYGDVPILVDKVKKCYSHLSKLCNRAFDDALLVRFLGKMLVAVSICGLIISIGLLLK